MILWIVIVEFCALNLSLIKYLIYSFIIYYLLAYQHITLRFKFVAYLPTFWTVTKKHAIFIDPGLSNDILILIIRGDQNYRPVIWYGYN